MLKNYLKIAIRNLRKNPGYSFINIAGLATGLAVCLIIGLYVQSELTYDRFHVNGERIYRVIQEETEDIGLAWSGPQMGLKLQEDFPQIETIMRVIDGGSGYGSRALISYEDKSESRIMRFNEDEFLYADPEFFNFFTFSLIRRSANEVLNRPGTVVITESIAGKYFQNSDPIGKTLLLNNRYPLEVTGVAADPPEHSHLQFNFVTSYRTFYAIQNIPGEVNSFWWPPTHTYLRLQNGASAAQLNEQLPGFAKRHRDADDASRLTPKLQPLSEIWLGPDYRGEQQAGGSMTYILLFSAVAVFILILACVNFVNLSTARGVKRAKEVGVRKTAGAFRTQLITQFLIESVFFSIAAMFMAFLMTELLLPIFNNIALKEVTIPYENGTLWTLVLVVIIMTGLGAGAYPALFLSGFRPALAIKSTAGQWARGAGLRKGLVVFQFTISMVLIAGTAVIYQQLRYTSEARMGFDEDHVVVLPGTGLSGGDEGSRYETLRSEMLNQSGVMQVTAGSDHPGQNTASIYVWEIDGLPDDGNRQFPAQFVGDDFFQMLEVEMLAGRPLRATDPADIGISRLRTNQDIQTEILENRAIVINETAANRFGWTPQDALGKQIRLYVEEGNNIYQDYRGNVVGVVEDYHTRSLYEPIEPVAYMAAQNPIGDYLSLRHILIKLKPGNMQQAMQSLEQTWKRVVPERPFEAVYLDETIDNLYRSEIRMGKLITAFTILAMFIACLGLFGLTAYAAESRTKEIGIRKILGATASQIIGLLSVDFIKLVLTGILIAIPITWYVMNLWLADFAYRIEPGPGIFILAGGAAILIALLTVSWQSIKAALMNPVDSLRSE
jgi:putative ABC transport system permease protein